MLTERECWFEINEIVSKALLSSEEPSISTAEVEKLNTYANFILIGRRVEALEEG